LQERLKIAKEFGDRAAERRAHSNLGNAHIFLGEFERAADHYKRTLLLAQELGDRAVEAQACYSLGNTYTLLKDYPAAIDYHLRHLRIAQELADKVGEGRACWSLGNAHSAMGQHDDAYKYATRHLEISRETGDRMGQATAQLNIAELARTLGYPEDGSQPPSAAAGNASPTMDRRPNRRISMEHMDLLKMTPDVKGKQQQQQQQQLLQQRANGHGHAAPMAQPESRPMDSGPVGGARAKEDLNKSGLLDDEEDFFDFISRFQSKRMDDQRCSLAVASKPPAPPPPSDGASAAAQPDKKKEELLDLIAGAQGGSRMDEQRAPVSSFLPGLPKARQPEILQRLSVAAVQDPTDAFPDESFFEMLMKCQGTRIEDQRSSLPADQRRLAPGAVAEAPRAPTVPDEDFFSLIQRVQGGRLEDQRAALPRSSNGASAAANSAAAAAAKP
jgi:G-protein signaling modulator 2